jgi:nucleotide-binding universal stress UspA family protein
MDTQNKVLACVDLSPYADYLGDYAAWAARRLNAPLKFLHIVTRHPEIGSGDDHSGAIGIGSQQNLLTRLSEQEAAELKAAHEKGRVFLNRLRERAIAAGVSSPDIKQRHGTLEETAVEQEPEVQLFVWGRRGESTKQASGKVGRNVESVVRALHKPILSVTAGFSEPTRVLFAYDGSSLARNGILMVADSPLLRGLPIHLLMSGKASSDGPKQMEWAKTTLEAAGFEVIPHLIPGDPQTVVAATIREQHIDLLIMGAYGHSPLRSKLFGCKTNALLGSVNIPILLLR